MGYLEQFARSRRRKEKTDVLTARLPRSLYSDFKAYCEDLGLSISEAVCLLVEREMEGFEGGSNEIATTIEKPIEYKKNGNIVATNTNIVKKKTNKSISNSKRFNTKHWQVNGQLPCPICNNWSSASNFAARHSKKHSMTTEQIFTSDEFKEKIESMLQAKKADQEKN